MRYRPGVTTQVNVLEIGHIPELHPPSPPHCEAEDLQFHPQRVHDIETLDQRLSEGSWDVVISVAQPEGVDPVEVVRCVKLHPSYCPVVMVAPVESLRVVLEATREGLDEYVVRGESEDVFCGLLAEAVRRALDHRQSAHNQEERAARIDRDFWTFFEAAPIGMDVLDLDGTILRANPMLENFLGYDARELQGRRFTEFTVAEESQEASNLLHALVSGERADYEHVSDRPQHYFVVDRRYRTRDGGVRWGNLVRLLMCYEDGSPRFVIGMIVDITERKRAHLALRHSEVVNQMILDTALDAIISIDESGTVHTFNRAAEQMFGYGKEEVVGQNVKMLVPSPHRENHDQYLERYHETGERHIIGTRQEVEGRRQDGTTFPLELGIAEADIDDLSLFTAVLRDLSDKKAMERQLRQAEKMEAIGQLAGGWPMTSTTSS